MKQLLLTFFFALTLSFAFAQGGRSCFDCYSGGDETFNNEQGNVNVGQIADAQLNRTMVYPNPATDYIKLKKSDGVAEVRIFNVVGRQVEAYRIVEKDQSFDINNLPNGMYLVQLISPGGKIIGTHRMNKR